MRNAKIYYAVFYEHEQTRAKVIYEIEPHVLLIEAERQLDTSRNQISHVSFSEAWVKRNGRVVYMDAIEIAKTPSPPKLTKNRS